MKPTCVPSSDHDGGQKLLDVDGGRRRVAGDVGGLRAVGRVHVAHQVGQDGGQLGPFALRAHGGQLALDRSVHGLAETFLAHGRVLQRGQQEKTSDTQPEPAAFDSVPIQKANSSGEPAYGPVLVASGSYTVARFNQ